MALAALPELVQLPPLTEPAQIMPLLSMIAAPFTKTGTEPEPDALITPLASFVMEMVLPVFVTSIPGLDAPLVEIVPLFVIVSALRVDVIKIPEADDPDVVIEPEFVILFDAAVAAVARTTIPLALLPAVVIEPELMAVLPPACERPLAPNEIP